MLAIVPFTSSSSKCHYNLQSSISAPFQKYANVFVMAAGSPEGINLNSHGWSDGTLVPERNPWLTKQRMPTPKGLNSRPLSMFNPFRVGSSIGHSHGFRLARHPWLFKLIPSGDAVKL